MKEIKNKEVIIGLIALIVLCITAIFLILKREFPKDQKNIVSVEEMGIEGAVNEEEAALYESTGNAASKKEAENGALETEKEALKQASEEQIAKKQSASKDSVEELELREYADIDGEYYTSPQYAEYTGENMWQLEELFYYWDEYKLEAVDDLVRLPRLRTAFTNELTGTNEFYYYGSLNKSGLPEGTGIAVYENNTYYCGEWKNGKRHGKGMWLQIFPDKPSTVNGVPGVVEHSYNGQWENDLPNGNGQEHFEYDLEEMEGEDIIVNVIGSYKDGYYDGELYIMTIEKNGSTIDWEASAQKGVFNYFHNRYSTTGKLPVWERMEEIEDGTQYRWLDETENVNWGISGLKK